MACDELWFISISDFARVIGVSQQAVSKAVQRERIRTYDDDGRLVPPGYSGKKWLKVLEAARDWDANRLRFD